jgi:hypothetical protein
VGGGGGGEEALPARLKDLKPRLESVTFRKQIRWKLVVSMHPTKEYEEVELYLLALLTSQH